MALRGAYFALVALAVVTFAHATPAWYARWAVAAAGLEENAGLAARLGGTYLGTPEGLWLLGRGVWLSLPIIELLCLAVWLGLAVLIYAKRSHETVALLVSFGFLGLGMRFADPWLAVGPEDPWALASRAGQHIVFIGTLLALYLFPDGRFTPRWSVWVLAPYILWQLLQVPFPALEPPPPSRFTPATLVNALYLASALVIIIHRYVRAGEGVQRQQLKWFMFGLAVPVVASLIAISMVIAIPWLARVTSGDPTATAVAEALVLVLLALLFLSFLAFPISTTAAMLRYRLFDIDLIINRAAGYAGTTLILVVAFALLSLAAQRTLEPILGQRSDLATPVLVVGLATSFAPVRSRLRPIVDRMFPAREMLALLFTDIVGSTAVAADLGDERWRELLGRYRVAVRRVLSEDHGHEVDTAGDGFFATFRTPLDAVAAGLAIAALSRTLGLESRVGVHVGSCDVRSEKPTGLTVHVAARVMGCAGPGQVLVSDAVREILGSRGPVLAGEGVHELKGIPGSWPLYLASVS